MQEILKFVEFNQYNLPFIIQILGLYLVMLYLALVAWVAKDITTRSQSFPIILTTIFFVLVGNIPALVIYLLVRPDATLDESKAQSLFQSSILDKKITNCGECGCLVRTDYKYCPSCSSEVNHRCMQCDHIVNPTWRFCTFCNYRLITEPWYIVWPQAAGNRIKAIFSSVTSIPSKLAVRRLANKTRLKANIKASTRKIETKNQAKKGIRLPQLKLPHIKLPKIKLPRVKIALPKLKFRLFTRKAKTAKLSIMAEKKHPVKLEKKVIVGEMSKTNTKTKKTGGRGRPKGLKDNKPRKKRADAGKKRGNYNK